MRGPLTESSSAATNAASKPSMRDRFLVIDGLGASVRLLGCAALEDCLPTVLARLQYEVVSNDDRPSFASVVCASGQYRLHGPRLGKPTYQKDEVNAACDLVGLIARQMAAGRVDRLSLHAAAVAVNGALIVFPAGRRAGKSLLTVALAQSGARLFGDDVLPIELVPGDAIVGIALGVSPRIRLPAPASAAPLIKSLEGLRSSENSQYRYIAVPQLANAGEHLPIGAFVGLRPADDGRARLEPTSRAATLRVLLKQNFGRSGRAQSLLEGLHGLASSAMSFELAYTNPMESAKLLLSELGPLLRPDPPIFSDMPTGGVPSAAAHPTNDAGFDETYVRNQGAMLRELDGEFFAASSDGERVLHFNEGLQRIWDLLDEPASAADLIGLMQSAFSEVVPQKIEEDVTAALGELAGAGLIVPSR